MTRSYKRSERLQIMVDLEELEAIDRWRFDHRMPSRAAAVRAMIRHALVHNNVPPASVGQHSTDFGVVPDKTSG